MPPTRVLIADDHPLIRSGLRALLGREKEFEVVGEAADGYQALELVEQLKPDVVMLDVSMPRLNGIDVAKKISATTPSTRIIIVSIHSDESYVLRALNVGARAYILKDSAEDDLIRAVRSVHAGKSFFSPAISRMLLDDYVRRLAKQGIEDSYDLLTPREKEVLSLLAEGLANKEVARKLGISVRTAETHREHLSHKLNILTVSGLTKYAIQHGLTSLASGATKGPP